MNRLIKDILFIILIAAAASQAAVAQREISREEYIATFAPLAIEHQNQYGIPASIKIAQGILESRYGNSVLSRRSNNHFGIKCKDTWKGDTVVFDDDARGECFRRYNTVEESYRDHSEFLKAGSRYAFLFKLDKRDYEGWARGLKSAGYATAPNYASTLIKCIEDWDLYLLDDGKMPAYLAGIAPVTFPSFGISVPAIRYGDGSIDIDHYIVSVFKIAGHGIFLHEGSRCISARQGETLASIARQIGISERRLRRYNKTKKGTHLAAGDVIFIEKPKRRHS